MSPLDKRIMKTLKNVQILLDVRSSFIWNSADTIDLRSSFLKGSARWQLIAITLRFIATLSTFPSVSHLSFSFHCTWDIQSWVRLCAWGEGGLSPFSGFICSFLVLSFREGWGGRGAVWLGTGIWTGAEVSLPLYSFNISDTCVTTAHTSRSWTARFCFDLMGGKKNTRMVMMISRWPLETNSMDRTGDFHHIFCLFFFWSIFCQALYPLPLTSSSAEPTTINFILFLSFFFFLRAAEQVNQSRTSGTDSIVHCSLTSLSGFA